MLSFGRAGYVPVRTRMSALSLLDLFTCDIFVKIEEESDESSWVEVRRRPVRNKSSLRIPTSRKCEEQTMEAALDFL